MLRRIPGVSLYHQIREHLREEIGRMDYGAKIKTESQLAAEYGVSRGTVRQAINELVNEGLLHKAHGVGTFKGGITIGYSRFWVNSLTKQLIACGLEPGTRDARVTSEIPEPRIAAMLSVPEGTQVWRLFRIRLGNGEPIAVCKAYIRKDIVPELKQEDLELSLVSMFSETFHVPLIKSESYCTASAAGRETAEILQVSPNSPIFRIDHLAYTEADTPVFFDITEAIGDKYIMRILTY